ncbi:hypothetical protein [Persephonella sp.]
MEFEKIIFLSVNGLSLILILILFVLFILERKKVKEKLTEESARLEKVVYSYFVQLNNEIKALKSEFDEIKDNVEFGVEKLKTEVKSFEDSTMKDLGIIKSEIKDLNKQIDESFKHLETKIHKLERLLKEPIDIEEWINESNR